jgi:hypothetical protein
MTRFSTRIARQKPILASNGEPELTRRLEGSKLVGISLRVA